MNLEDKIALTADFPEAPKWVLNRDWSLKDARNAMITRRREFPSTRPKTADDLLYASMFRMMKHGSVK